MTTTLKEALEIVYQDIVAVNEKADTNATNIETNTSNIETLQTQVSTNTTQLSTNTSNIETLQQEVANLKASASGVLYNETEVSGVGYELSVSENALPYGTMDIVGGMSYKVLDDETSEYIIQDTPITSIISKDSNDNTLATGEIPDEVQALLKYRVSIGYISSMTRAQSLSMPAYTGGSFVSYWSSDMLYLYKDSREHITFTIKLKEE